MVKRENVISIGRLPARLKKLSIEDVQSVYGGCAGHLENCTKSSDCCQDMYQEASCRERYDFETKVKSKSCY
jgi:hypothetical protein